MTTELKGVRMTIKMIDKDTVSMSRAEYEDLIDARDHAIALRDMAAGSMPILNDDDMDAYLATPTALAFWRKHRRMTQVDLAAAAEISQPYLAQLESGQREAMGAVYNRLAHRLGVRVDDLL